MYLTCKTDKGIGFNATTSFLQVRQYGKGKLKQVDDFAIFWKS